MEVHTETKGAWIVRVRVWPGIALGTEFRVQTHSWGTTVDVMVLGDQARHIGFLYEEDAVAWVKARTSHEEVVTT